MGLRPIVLAAAIATALFSPTLVEARGGGVGGVGHGSSVSAGTGHSSAYCGSCSRDSRGHIARSEVAKKDFEAQTGFPHGRRGYVVDHVVALKRGGTDSPSNMQWQTKADAKAKDKVE